MAIPTAFYEDLSSNDIRGIRITMKNSLLLDATFVDFDQMSKLAANVQGLYDTHDGEEFHHDRTKWDDTYMNHLLAGVVTNFSHERIAHVKRVIAYLHPAPKTEIPVVEPQDFRDEQMRDEALGRIVKSMSVGFIGGATIGALFADVVGKSLLVGGGIGSLVGCGLGYFCMKGLKIFNT